MDMGSCYANSLAPEIAQRYQEKLQLFCDNVDPYSLDSNHCSTSVADLPNVSGHSIRSYLLLSKCPYSGRAGDTAATPDEYSDPDQSGWVTRTFVKKLDDIVIVLGELQILDTGEFLNPWFVAFPNGYVLCAHCTCAAGTNETCIHIVGLLHRVQQLRESVGPGDGGDNVEIGGGDGDLVVKLEPPDDTSDARNALRRVRREIIRQQQAETQRSKAAPAPVIVSLRRLNAVAASVAGRSQPKTQATIMTTPSTMSTAAATAAAINRSVAAAADAAPKPIVLNFSNGLRKINIVTARTVYDVAGIPVSTTAMKSQPYQGSLRLIPATAGDARTAQAPLKIGAAQAAVPQMMTVSTPVASRTATTSTTTTTKTPSPTTTISSASPRRRGKTRTRDRGNNTSSESSSPTTSKRPARIKLYVCGICTAQFGDKDSFMQHCQLNHALPLGGVAAAPTPPLLGPVYLGPALLPPAMTTTTTSTSPPALVSSSPAGLTVPVVGERPGTEERAPTDSIAALAQSQLNNLRNTSRVCQTTAAVRRPRSPPAPKLLPIQMVQVAARIVPSMLVTTPPSIIRQTARRQLVRLLKEVPPNDKRLPSYVDPLRKVAFPTTATATITVKQEPDLVIEAETTTAVDPSYEVMVEEYLTEDMNDDDDDNGKKNGGNRGNNNATLNDDDDDDDCIVIKQEPDLVIVDDDDDDDEVEIDAVDHSDEENDKDGDTG